MPSAYRKRDPSRQKSHTSSREHPKRTRYYHASPRRFKVGTVLRPGTEPKKSRAYINFGRTDQIYLTTSPIPHHTILAIAKKDKWHVYEVEPLGKVRVGIWDDLTVDRAEVIAYVGNARGIARKHTQGSLAVGRERTGHERSQYFQAQQASRNQPPAPPPSVPVDPDELRAQERSQRMDRLRQRGPNRTRRT